MQPTASSPLDSARSNYLVGWSSVALGALTGLVLGLWSFDGPVPEPAGFDSYADLSRRLARLGHIAFFGLGIMNLLLARDLKALLPSLRLRRWTARSMNFGNLVLPLTLFAAAIYHPLKFVLPLPALAVTLALLLAARGVWYRDDTSRL